MYTIQRISDGKAVFGEGSEMAAMIEAALVNGASGVKAVKREPRIILIMKPLSPP